MVIKCRICGDEMIEDITNTEMIYHLTKMHVMKGYDDLIREFQDPTNWYEEVDE